MLRQRSRSKSSMWGDVSYIFLGFLIGVVVVGVVAAISGVVASSMLSLSLALSLGQAIAIFAGAGALIAAVVDCIMRCCSSSRKKDFSAFLRSFVLSLVGGAVVVSGIFTAAFFSISALSLLNLIVLFAFTGGLMAGFAVSVKRYLKARERDGFHVVIESEEETLLNREEQELATQKPSHAGRKPTKVYVKRPFPTSDTDDEKFSRSNERNGSLLPPRKLSVSSVATDVTSGGHGDESSTSLDPHALSKSLDTYTALRRLQAANVALEAATAPDATTESAANKPTPLSDVADVPAPPLAPDAPPAPPLAPDDVPTMDSESKPKGTWRTKSELTPAPTDTSDGSSANTSSRSSANKSTPVVHPPGASDMMAELSTKFNKNAQPKTPEKLQKEREKEEKEEKERKERMALEVKRRKEATELQKKADEEKRERARKAREELEAQRKRDGKGALPVFIPKPAVNNELMMQEQMAQRLAARNQQLTQGSGNPSILPTTNVGQVFPPLPSSSGGRGFAPHNPNSRNDQNNSNEQAFGDELDKLLSQSKVFSQGLIDQSKREEAASVSKYQSKMDDIMSHYNAKLDAIGQQGKKDSEKLMEKANAMLKRREEYSAQLFQSFSRSKDQPASALSTTKVGQTFVQQSSPPPATPTKNLQQ